MPIARQFSRVANDLLHDFSARVTLTSSTFFVSPKYASQCAFFPMTAAPKSMRRSLACGAREFAGAGFFQRIGAPRSARAGDANDDVASSVAAIDARLLAYARHSDKN